MATESLKVITKAMGVSGTEVTGGVYTEEYLTSLQGIQAAEIYNRMRRGDTQVKKILNAITNPIKSAKWNISPASDDAKDIEVAALMEQIFFKDVRWHKFLNEALTFIPHGFSVFEVIHENKQSKEFGNYSGLSTLAFRTQTSISEWNHDAKTGELLSVKQEAFGDFQKQTILPRDILLIFFNEQEGDNNGTPMLRALYGPYKRKLLALELGYIGLERFSIPTPLVKVPSKIRSDMQEYKDAQRELEAYVSAENAYFMYPEGWEVDLSSNSVFDPTKIKDMIKFENEEMSGAILASFLELGTGGNSGAYALATDLSSFFFAGIESFPKQITDTINNCLIPHLVRLNYGDSVGVMPEMSFSGIADKAGKELMEIVTGYTAAGIINTDEMLEDHVRNIHDLPKKADGEQIDNQESEDSASDSNTDGINDTGDTSDSSSEPDNNDSEEVALSENIKLAEAKTPRSLISQEQVKVTEVMRRNLQEISDKYIRDGIRNYKKLSDTNKLKAFDKVKVGGKTKFKKELRIALIQLAEKSIEMARAEIPNKKNVKLNHKSKWGDVKLPEDMPGFKFQDFSKLPRHVQLLLQRQTNAIAEKYTGDAIDRVQFSFGNSESSTRDPLLIENDLQAAADDFIKGGNIPRGAANVSATLINDARQAFFLDKDVVDTIHSFTYINPSPVAQVCIELAGKTFQPNDAEFLRHTPPNHHNCKSYLKANLKGSSEPEITGFPGLSQSARDSITLKED